MAQTFRVISFRRWSSRLQTDGDSDRRQLAAALAYCKARGWTLDEELVDPGKSAYRNEHMQEGGALWRFFDRVSKGEIRPGDVLLFEGFDRFSRQPPDIALPRFLDLIRAGIEVHTILDGQVFTKQSIRTNQGQLYGTLSAMWGSYLDSKNKGKRVKDAWIRRREARTLLCPAWIRPNADRTAYECIPECVAVIIRIFKLAIAGHGVQTICRMLNADKVPAFERALLPGTKPGRKPSTGWHHAYVRNLLKTRRVLGEVELREWVAEDDGDAKAVKTGETRKLFPAAISEELWQQAQDARRSERHGRNGAQMVNLFGAKLAKCVCGASMSLVRKGARNQYTYLQCSDARRGETCTYSKLHRYEPIEDFVLALFGELAYGEIEPDDGLSAVRTEVAKAQRDADAIEARYNREADAIGKGKGGLGAKRLAALETQHADAMQRVETLQRKLRSLQAQPLDKQLAAVQTLIADMDRLGGEERVAVRSRINTGLRGFVQAVVFNDPKPPQGKAFGYGEGWYVWFADHLPPLPPTKQAALVAFVHARQHDDSKIVIQGEMVIWQVGQSDGHARA